MKQSKQPSKVFWGYDFVFFSNIDDLIVVLVSAVYLACINKCSLLAHCREIDFLTIALMQPVQLLSSKVLFV